MGCIGTNAHDRYCIWVKPGNGPESESNIITMSFFPRLFLFLNVFERKTQRLSALLTSEMTSYICDDVV